MQASGLPGVAVLGIGGLANVEFASEVVEIVVLGENDDASRKVIDKAAPLLAEKGIKVRVALPPQGFGDFNDLIDPSKDGGGPGGLVIAKMIIEAAPRMAAKTRGVIQAKRESGEELAGELSGRARGSSMRVVHRLAGRGLRRHCRLA